MYANVYCTAFFLSFPASFFLLSHLSIFSLAVGSDAPSDLLPFAGQSDMTAPMHTFMVAFALDKCITWG